VKSSRREFTLRTTRGGFDFFKTAARIHGALTIKLKDEGKSRRSFPPKVPIRGATAEGAVTFPLRAIEPPAVCVSRGRVGVWLSPQRPWPWKADRRRQRSEGRNGSSSPAWNWRNAARFASAQQGIFRLDPPDRLSHHPGRNPFPGCFQSAVTAAWRQEIR
jgi:hypothetical protein